MLLDICAIFLRDRKQNNEKISSTVSLVKYQAYRANRPKIVQFLGKLLLKLFGWKVDIVPEMDENENLVIIAAPIPQTGMVFLALLQ